MATFRSITECTDEQLDILTELELSLDGRQKALLGRLIATLQHDPLRPIGYKPEDNVRVMRFIEYIGPREAVEDSLRHRMVKGERRDPGRQRNEVVMREGFIGEFPERWLLPAATMEQGIPICPHGYIDWDECVDCKH